MGLKLLATSLSRRRFDEARNRRVPPAVKATQAVLAYMQTRCQWGIKELEAVRVVFCA